MNRKILVAVLLLCVGAAGMTALISWNTKDPRPSREVIQTAVTKGFSLLQTSGVKFIIQGKCASCHHSTLTSMVAEKMAAKGVGELDTTAGMRKGAMSNSLHYIGNPNLNNQFIQAKFIAPYVLLGLAAEKYPADFNTDISVAYLMSQQLPDGSFQAEYMRTPLESGDIHLSAFAIRAIQLYASPAKAAQTKKMVQLTKAWLEKQEPTVQQELAMQLLGLRWTSGDEAVKKKVSDKLYAMQNNDGGWSQLPTLKSDAYATGQALFALVESGQVAAHDADYQRGIAYLLQTQQASGAWVVMTRSNPIQPYINADFPPYDENQFISAAASNWATLALADALPDKR
jgi:hypothetical protein